MKFVQVGAPFLRKYDSLKSQFNMQIEQQQLWQGILHMSDTLKHLSDDQDWSAMIDLESRRKEKIQAFFASGISEADANEVAQGIRQILNTDSQLLSYALAFSYLYDAFFCPFIVYSRLDTINTV